MGRPGRRPQRLTELVKAAGIDISDPTLDLRRPDLPIVTTEQTIKVYETLRKLRIQQYETKKSFKFMRQDPSKKPLDSNGVKEKEATLVLNELFETTCSAGAALLLLSFGADVNLSRQKSGSIHKKVRGKDQDNIRSNIFERAIESGDECLVNVLADKADAENLNHGLKIALYHRNLAMIQILMLMGANPNFCQREFTKAITSGDAEIISLLSSGIVPLSAEIASQGLYEMLRRGHSNVVRMLLWHGADANGQSPSVLEYATKFGNIVDVASLCLAEHHPLPGSLAQCAARCCADLDNKSPVTLLTLELLLAAGAEGKEISEALLEAIKQRQHSLVNLLVEYSQFDDGITPVVFMAAVLSADIKLFRTVLTLANSSEALTGVLMFLQTTQARNLVTLDLRAIMTSTVLHLGPTQQALTAALFIATENAELMIVKCLVEAGASVDCDSGRILITAIKQQSMPLLSTLLSRGNLSKSALSNAMKSTHDLPLDLKLEMTQAIICAGAEGGELSLALKAALVECKGSPVSYELMKVLLQAGAAVGLEADGCLVSAVKDGDVQAVELLLRYIPVGSNPEVPFLAACALRDLDTRYSITRSLISAGASGLCITKTLVDVLERFPEEKRFTELLVRKGALDVDLCEGQAVSLAVAHQDIELLHMLMKVKPSTSTLNRAICAATSLERGQLKLEICRLLLKEGAEGDQVGDALLCAAMSCPPEMDLVTLLVSFGASVDHKSGSVLCVALNPDGADIELLNVLLQQTAQPSTMTRALSQALALRDEEQKLTAIQSLLNTSTKIPAESLGALLPETLHDEEDLRLLHMLLEHGASVNTGSLEGFRKAIRMNSRPILTALMNASPIDSTIQRVFEYAWGLREKNGFDLLAVVAKDSDHRQTLPLDHYLILTVDEVTPSMPSIEFLLSLGISPVVSEGRSIQICVERLQLAALQILLEHTSPEQLEPSIIKMAFKRGELWDQEVGVHAAWLLLQSCAWQEVLDEILIDAAIQVDSRPNAVKIAECLIACRASADYRYGQALVEATRRGHIPLVDRLLDTNPSSTTINRAFSYILKSKTNHDEVVQSIRSFVNKSQKKLDLNKPHEELDPVLFMCMSREDRSVPMMEELLSSGASVHQTSNVFLDHAEGNDEVSILLYAIYKACSEPDSAIVRSLIRRGANVNLISPSTGTTSLFVAISKGHPSIVQDLIGHGVDVATKDPAGFTPLCWAARLERIAILQMLITAGAPSNDGSLHEAVSIGNPKVLSVLLKSEHDPNFPSPMHNLRGGIEIALRQSHRYAQVEDLNLILKLLCQHGATPRYRRDGKSLLIMALDLQNADKIVQPLLSAFMGSMINDELNLYRDQGLIYSPLSYVKESRSRCPASQRDVLTKVLSSYGCDEVYYHESGPQPRGFKGAPAHLVKREDERQERLRVDAERSAQHQAEIRRIEELAAAKLEAQRREHEAAQSQYRTEQLEQEIAARHRHEAEVARQTQRAALALDSERTLARVQLDKNQQVEGSLERQNAIQARAATSKRMEEEAEHNARVRTERQILEMTQRQLQMQDAYGQRSHHRQLQAAVVQQRLLAAGYAVQRYPQAYLPAYGHGQRQITSGYVQEIS